MDEVDERRFRMNFGIDGLGEHEEDGWLGRRVRLGEAVVVPQGNVGRCAVTTQNPDTGAPDLDTLKALAAYRGSSRPRSRCRSASMRRLRSPGGCASATPSSRPDCRMGDHGMRPPIPILRMYDVEATRRFYVDYLGFDLDWQDGEGDRRVYMRVSRGPVALHLSSLLAEMSSRTRRTIVEYVASR